MRYFVRGKIGRMQLVANYFKDLKVTRYETMNFIEIFALDHNLVFVFAAVLLKHKNYYKIKKITFYKGDGLGRATIEFYTPKKAAGFGYTLEHFLNKYKEE